MKMVWRGEIVVLVEGRGLAEAARPPQQEVRHPQPAGTVRQPARRLPIVPKIARRAAVLPQRPPMPVQVLVSQLQVVAARHPRQPVVAPVHQRPIPPRRLRGIDS